MAAVDPYERAGEAGETSSAPAAGSQRAESRAAELTRVQIRGSSLLLSGKATSVGAKFVAQILMVRYLSTGDYGAWVYALSVVTLLGGFAHLSLDRALPRFASIYNHRSEHHLFYGTLLLVTAVIALTGLLFVGGLYAFPGLFGRLTDGGGLPLALLFILIFLVPLEALDSLLLAVFATFNRASAMFVRRYVVTPAVQLGVVLLLIALKADVFFLAWGYMAGTALGVGVSLWFLPRILREQGLWHWRHLRSARVPARELFGFSLPLMTSDGLAALTQSSGALVLGYLHGVDAVALFRVVLPMAALNQLVIRSFNSLYEPNAARLYAAGDVKGLNDFYWRTSVWIAVISFPVFAVTFATATPLTVLFFGETYRESGSILAILALGQYANACVGFNGSTMSVLGRVRLMVASNVLAALLNVVLILALVPELGATGAALALSGTLIGHNLIKQLMLRRVAGVKMLDSRYLEPFAALAVASGLLVVVRWVGEGRPLLAWAGASLAVLAVLALSRRTLQVLDVFPEIRRVPLLRALVS